MLNLEHDKSAEEIDYAFMMIALREAEFAAEKGEIPIGAVVVHEGKVIGRGHNQNKTLKDPTAHAEMIAISAACAKVESRYIENATLYVTVEPCAMCAGAAVLARLARIVFGARDPKAGACGSLFNIGQDPRLNHMVDLTAGVCEAECGGMITGFFEKIRSRQKQ